MSEADAVESIVRARLGIVLDNSQTVVTAAAAWVGVYAAVAPGAITSVWASLVSDANSDTDRRVGLLSVMHEALKNCARRGGSDDVIRQFVLAVRRDVPAAITAALALEPADGSEFRRCAYLALRTWKSFTGFLPAQWLDATVSQLAATESGKQGGGGGGSGGGHVGGDSSGTGGGDGSGKGGAGAGDKAANDAMSSAMAGLDSVAAESSGLAQVLRLFQKYNAALERLRRFEADPSASAAAIESVRDDVLHRSQPLLNALGTPEGKFGFIPAIQGEIKRIQQQQQQNSNGEDDAADPLADFFQ